MQVLESAEPIFSICISGGKWELVGWPAQRHSWWYRLFAVQQVLKRSQFNAICNIRMVARARGLGHVALAIPFGLFSTTTAVAPLACVNTVCAKRAKNCQCSNYISSAHRQIYNTRFVERYFFLRFASCGTMAGCWWLGVRLMRPFLFSPKKEPIGGIDFAIGTKSAIHIQCRCANERLMDESAMEKSREMHFCCCCCLTALLIVVWCLTTWT